MKVNHLGVMFHVAGELPRGYVPCRWWTFRPWNCCGADLFFLLRSIAFPFSDMTSQTLCVVLSRYWAWEQTRSLGTNLFPVISERHLCENFTASALSRPRCYQQDGKLEDCCFKILTVSSFAVCAASQRFGSLLYLCCHAASHFVYTGKTRFGHPADRRSFYRCDLPFSQYPDSLSVQPRSAFSLLVFAVTQRHFVSSTQGIPS